MSELSVTGIMGGRVMGVKRRRLERGEMESVEGAPARKSVGRPMVDDLDDG